MKMPKAPAPRNGNQEINNAGSLASSLYGSRNGQLSGGTVGDFGSYLSALTSGRTGEMGTYTQWLRKNAPALRTANQYVQNAAGMATAPTALSGALDSSAATALSNPTAGNTTLNNLVSTAGPSPVLSTMQTQALSGLNDNGQLTPEEARLAVQGGRAAAAATGMEMGSGASLSDVLNRAQYVQARQDRARGYAGETQQLTEASRNQDLGVAGMVQGATDAGRQFAQGVNAQDLTKQARNFDVSQQAANFRLQTNPALMAYNTTSMAPTALSAAGATSAQADVFPQVLAASQGVNDFNANAQWSQYMNSLNRYYAMKYGGMGAMGAAGNGGGFNAGGAAMGAVTGAASGAMMGSVVPGVGTAVGAVAGGLIGGLGGGLG
jgi:hypothetical protein